MKKETVVILTGDEVEAAVLDYIGIDTTDESSVKITRSRKDEGSFRVEILEDNLTALTAQDE